MKIEIGESLGYSYLRHVKQCWLVQVNWKASEHWAKHMTDAELEAMFAAMRRKFDPDGSVFKKSRDAAQFLRQGEIDVLGVNQNGGVHAMEVAFHEGGLNYGGGVANRVLKKLLRTMMLLTAYHSSETRFHIYLVSPKVNHSDQEPLEETFTTLRTEYPEVEWNLIINQDFTDQVMKPTLEKAGTVADTSELFMRSAKLLALSRDSSEIGGNVGLGRTTNGAQQSGPGQIQPLVQKLMNTLLEDYPTLLNDVDLHNLMNQDYCKNTVGLQISNLALLRSTEARREISGHNRYWKKLYAGKFYVCSQWWKSHHIPNAESLLRFVSGLGQRNRGHQGVPALKSHEKALDDYIRRG